MGRAAIASGGSRRRAAGHGGSCVATAAAKLEAPWADPEPGFAHEPTAQ
jgi:hypothetical protein